VNKRMSGQSIHLSEEIFLAKWARKPQRSALQEMLSIASCPGIISFALGLPAPEFFPTNMLAALSEQVLKKNPAALQYSPALQTLKKQIVELMALRGVRCHEQQIFLTAGAQQGVNLLTHLLLDQNGLIIMEEKTYTGAQQVFALFQPKILAVPTDQETGIDVAAIEDILSSGIRPAFIYTIPSGHNPLSVTMSWEKRIRLAELAHQYQVPVIEDDPYGFIYYNENPTPPLRSIEDKWVFYVGSFSKILGPTFRVGWIVINESLLQHLSIVKEATDIDTVTLTQRIISAYLETGNLNQHLIALRAEYRKRRDAMLTALQNHFPLGARWTIPESGFFVWVELPEPLDMIGLLKTAVEKEGVAFIPGQAFSVLNRDRNESCLRLNFSYSSVENIEIGIARLARLLKSL
ncbi:MAG: PLP-dependent aminotransferase family protein, partial [Acidobacteriota bacterium]